MSDNIDHEYTPEIVCPHCGHVHEDSCEFSPGDEDGEDKCGECDRPFTWSRHITVKYSTEKKEKPWKYVVHVMYGTHTCELFESIPEAIGWMNRTTNDQFRLVEMFTIKNKNIHLKHQQSTQDFYIECYAALVQADAEEEL